MGPYEPTRESLAQHSVPKWYHDTKLGIFIHWGIYSVPAWAPDPDESNSAYAEWYPRYMYVEESPTYEYHRNNYGEKEYLDFVHDWKAENWDPEEWATLFENAGAGYVVITGEHHDGFPLWPSHYTKYNAGELGPKRDLVGDFAQEVRKKGMKFAASYHANLNYYQPGFTGPFGHPDYNGSVPFEDTDPGPEYVDFMNAKHRELIRRYKPDFLWFDTPQADADQLRANELIADYYNRAENWGKDVLVNDRASTDHDGLAGLEPDEDGPFGGDIATPEYTSFDEIKPFKWETCRGIGHSFGYNAREGVDDHLSAEELIHLFVDVVSKNGNLLINVGPRADGTIPELQKRPLNTLGEWLSINGEAIYATRPWIVAEDEASSVDVRYTWRDGDCYAIALEWPGETLSLSVPKRVDEEPSRTALLTGAGEKECEFTIEDQTLEIALPVKPDHGYAYAIRLENIDT